MEKLEDVNKYPVLNTYGWFIIIINLAFAIINITSLCIIFPRTKELGFDYIGVIVGVLSVLVTVVLGWQIFNTISIERTLNKKLNNASKTLKSEIDNKLSDVSLEIDDKRYASNVMSLYQSSCSAYLLKEYDFAFWLALDAMSHYSKIKNKSTISNNEYANMVYLLEKCIGSVIKVKFLDINQINEYIACASNLGLYQVAYHLKNNSIPSDSSIGGYITRKFFNKLDENNIDSTNINNSNNIFITHR